MDIDRRLANLVKRLHRMIDDRDRLARLYFCGDVAAAREKLDEAFTTAARSLGQSRRHRNNREE